MGRLMLPLLIATALLGGGAAHAQAWRSGDHSGPVCLADCAAPAPTAAAEPPAALFTPRITLGAIQTSAAALSLGAPMGVETALTLSAGAAPAPGEAAGYGLGAGLAFLGVELGGRYVWSEGEGSDGLALGGSYALGALTLGGGVTLPLEAGGEGAVGALEARYRLVPGVTVSGALSISGSGGSGDPEPINDISAGVSLRLRF